MADQIVRLGPEYFPDPSTGRPIAGGSIYVGEPDTDPKVEINQKQISVLQEDGSTVDVDQPLLTSAGGMPVYNGSTVTIKVDGQYSLRILDSLESQKYYVPTAGEPTDATSPTVDYVKDLIGLINIATPSDDQTHTVLSFFDGLNKGSGQFYWDSSADKATANGGTIIDPDTIGGFDGTTGTRDAFLAAQGGGVGFGCWIRSYNGDINARWFGAVGDNVTDDTVALQTALDWAALYSDGAGLFIPGGTYIISSGLVRTGEVNHLDIYGAGKGSTLIDGSVSTIGVMLTIGPVSDPNLNTIHGSLKDIRFNGSATVGIGIDFTETPGMTIKEVEASNCVIGMRGGSWETVISDCKFRANTTGLMLATKQAFNIQAVNIKDNVFTGGDVGIDAEDFINHVNIVGNTFDSLISAGVVARWGGRSVAIERNYFEKCGLTGAGVDIQTGASTFDTGILADIILGYNYASGDFTFSGTVLNNSFHNSCRDRMIATYSIGDLHVDDNHMVSYSTPCAIFTDMRGLGSVYQFTKRCRIFGAYDSTFITEFLGLNVISPGSISYTNMEVSNRLELTEAGLYKYFGKQLFLVNDLLDTTLWTWGGAIPITMTRVDGSGKEFMLATDVDTTKQSLIFNTTLSVGHPLLGRYVRVNMYSWGQTRALGTAGTARIIIRLNSVIVLDRSQTYTQYGDVGRTLLIAIPQSEVGNDMRVEITQLTSDSITYVKGFSICDAAIPIDSFLGN